MSIDEYISQNHPFYHITPMKNLKSILQGGICKSKSKTRDGICVVRTSDDDIIHEIIDTQLQEIDCQEEQLFALIRLCPEKHHITAADVTEDPIQEGNKCLYNYLDIDVIHIDEDDIVRKDLKVGESGNLKILKDIVELSGYRKNAPRIVSV